MAVHMDGTLVTNVLNKFSEATSNPEKFLSVQEGLYEQFKHVTKSLYDKGINTLKNDKISAKINTTVLPELLVEGFDEEQIWQELELNNEASYNRLLQRVSKLVSSRTLSLKKTPKAVTVKEPADDEEEKAEESDNDSIASKVTLDEDEEEDDDDGFGSQSDGSGDLNFDAFKELEESDEGEDVTQQRREKPKKTVRQTEVDDQFFKLGEMEAFLEREDRREEMRGKQLPPAEDDEDDDESSVDYFQDIPSEDEEDEDESGRNAKYSDFFGTGTADDTGNDEDKMDLDEEEEGDDDENMEEDEESENDQASKRVRFNLDAESSEGEDIADIFGGSKNKAGKSPFEERQERLKSRIQELEDEAVAEKSWQLLGEVTAEARPENALLEEDLQFDHTTRQAPVITEETSKTLEDIIRRRIKDAAFDDVERKIKPVADPREYKKQLVLDQEKSKFSLAELYEQEYLKAQEQQQQQPSASLADPVAEKESTDENHAAIRKMMTSLFSKLDALSNFHYTPKMVNLICNIVKNKKIKGMRISGPVAVSDANLLAPEEVAERPRGDIKSTDERTKTDKLRERRHKKAKQHDKFQQRQKLEKALPADKKQGKAQVLRHLEQAEKDGTVTLIKGRGNNPLKSSTAFFSQLQDTVAAEVKGIKAKIPAKAKDEQKVSGRKLKL
nr:EOG090X09DZ [Eulimnadia texana]